jgi:predicted amidohydrolase YtcJ
MISCSDGSHGAWSSNECLGREEALAAFTAAPAYASGDLHRLGTLTPGKLASDMVLEDRR